MMVTYDDTAKLIKDILDVEGELRKSLNKPAPRKHKVWSKLSVVLDSDPVRTKHLEIIAELLLRIATCLESLQESDSPVLSGLGSLKHLIKVDLKELEELSSSSAWELSGLLEIEHARLANNDFADAFLKTEEKETTPEKPSRPVEKSEAQARDAVQRLLWSKNSKNRANRCRTDLQRIYLIIMMTVLLVVLVCMCISYAFASSSNDGLWALVLLVMFSGALGSVLSNALKIGLPSRRGSATSQASEPPIGIHDIAEASNIYFAQPVVGAAAGFIVYLIFSAALATIEGTPLTVEGYAVLTFLAGFSEPFFIGILDKVAGEAGGSLS